MTIRPVLDFALGRDRLPSPAWLPELLQEQAPLACRRGLPEERQQLTQTMSVRLQEVFGVQVVPDQLHRFRDIYFP